MVELDNYPSLLGFQVSHTYLLRNYQAMLWLSMFKTESQNHRLSYKYSRFFQSFFIRYHQERYSFSFLVATASSWCWTLEQLLQLTQLSLRALNITLNFTFRTKDKKTVKFDGVYVQCFLLDTKKLQIFGSAFIIEGQPNWLFDPFKLSSHHWTRQFTQQPSLKVTMEQSLRDCYEFLLQN